MALTRDELDQGGCGTPGCAHDHSVMFLVARCHPNAGSTVMYDKRTGNIRVMCARCEDPIADVAVAKSAADAKRWTN